jgi:TPP-dependent pyruvate/acetoin dehydrogenase alpha subunit
MEYDYSKEELLDMYQHLKRARLFTLKMQEAVMKGLIRIPFHTPYGQENIAVGIVSALRKTDWFGYMHRSQSGLIMRYGTYKFIAELFGRRDGIRRGAAFDFHLMDVAEDGLRIAPYPPVLGGSVPMNTGLAFARKMLGKDEVVVAISGDGTCSEGAVYEAWNLAALYKVPIVFVIENNEWANTVPLHRQSFISDISKKAEACGLPAMIVTNGYDLLEVRRAMELAIAKARSFQPNVVEIKAIRWGEHCYGMDGSYRDDQDKVKDAMANKDCVKVYEKYLMKRSVIDQAYIDEFTLATHKTLDAEIERASRCEKPQFDDIYRKEFIYASPETGGDL